MEWTALEVIEYMDKSEETQVFICIKKESKKWRSINQNNTFYKLFTDIGNHLWETKEDVHDMMLWWIFWTKEVRIWIITREVNIEKHTSKLTKEQWIKFIDTMLAFVKRENMPITVTSREITSLYDSFNN